MHMHGVIISAFSATVHEISFALLCGLQCLFPSHARRAASHLGLAVERQVCPVWMMTSSPTPTSSINYLSTPHPLLLINFVSCFR
jgi:hypothetical protein